MRGLSALSKFIGCYEMWQKIKRSAGLKWVTTNKEQLIKDLISGNEVEEAVSWLREVEKVLPQKHFKAIKFILYTGLRPDEGCKAINLIAQDLENYLDRSNMTLQHFKYPAIFLRRTKNAYVTFVTPEMLEWAKEAAPITYTAIRLACKKRGLDCKLKLLRKVWATTLREAGIPSEIIDLLQGRIQPSVFAKHYYRPDLLGEIRAKVLEGLKRLP
jgi:intergrase/recombinase